MEENMSTADNGLHTCRSGSLRARQRGWGAGEYLSVLLGLMVVWWGAQRILTLVQEHHDEYIWALMMPF
jgi:hypothetical protein